MQQYAKSCTSAQGSDTHGRLHQRYTISARVVPILAVAVITMANPKYTARIDNIYFLARIGESLRWATEDITREQLPSDIQHLLARLDRLEARAEAKRQKADNDTP